MQSRTYIFIERQKRLYIAKNANNFILEDATDSYGIDTIRQLKKWSILKPFNAPIKIGLIHHAHKLTTEAQNALLKLLEEPPNNTLIFLSVKNKDLLLNTITSRCYTLTEDEISTKVLPEEALSQITLTPIENVIKEAIPHIENELDAFELANDLAKKYSRQQILDILENWLELLTNTTSASAIKKADSILHAKENISHNTNIRLTLDVMFLDWLR